jgi:hypothetical protein
MKSSYIRIGMAAALLGFLFVFFVPVVYSSNLTYCQLHFYNAPPGACIAPSNPGGVESIGTALFGSGAAYLFEGGYSVWGTGFGALILVVLPMTIASILLLSPEIVRAGSSIRKLAFDRQV